MNMCFFFKCHRLERRVARLEEEFREFRELAAEQLMQLTGEISEIKAELISLRTDLTAVQEELANGLTTNPELRQFLTAKLGLPVTVTVTDGTIAGVVIQVGTDAVEIREETGELVLIPYSQISAVQ